MSNLRGAAAFDQVLDALDHLERRRLLLSLLKTDGDEPEVTLDQIEGTGADIELAMHHSHLPKLQELGFVSVDGDPRTVRPGERFDEIRPLLELLDENRDRLPAELD